MYGDISLRHVSLLSNSIMYKIPIHLFLIEFLQWPYSIWIIYYHTQLQRNLKSRRDMGAAPNLPQPVLVIPISFPNPYLGLQSQNPSHSIKLPLLWVDWLILNNLAHSKKIKVLPKDFEVKHVRFWTTEFCLLQLGEKFPNSNSPNFLQKQKKENNLFKAWSQFHSKETKFCLLLTDTTPVPSQIKPTLKQILVDFCLPWWKGSEEESVLVLC